MNELNVTANRSLEEEEHMSVFFCKLYDLWKPVEVHGPKLI